MLTFESLAVYWTGPILTANVIVVLTVFGALLLGLVVGYERSYHGRAAGMRTYGLVSMASAALTVIAGYSDQWFGGHILSAVAADPGRIIQGIVTGIGFLGAGVIMKEGFNISGLTTAASLWASSVIGVLVGVGFFGSALLLGSLSALCMTLVTRLEAWLPSRHAIAIELKFKQGFNPSIETVRKAALEHGYEVAGGSLSISFQGGQPEWRFVAVALDKRSGAPLPLLAQKLAVFDGVESFLLAHARN